MHQHNSNKLLKVDVPITIDICHRNHLLDLFLREFALESLADLVQLRLTEPLFILCVENFEGL